MGDQHFCKASDGMNIVCFCVRGVDHTEAEFDQPVREGKMREIKFRAWDTHDKVYFINVLPVPSGINYSFEYTAEQPYVLIPIEPRYIFEQYTGLKDKNGKEIYEGDILKLTDHQDYIAPVEWNGNRDACFQTNHFLRREWSQSEVIGNIYENPELSENNK